MAKSPFKLKKCLLSAYRSRQIWTHGGESRDSGCFRAETSNRSDSRAVFLFDFGPNRLMPFVFINSFFIQCFI